MCQNECETPDTGASVQPSTGGELLYWTDREIMKKTILRGEHTVYVNDVCDAIRKSIAPAQSASGGLSPALCCGLVVSC